MFLAEKCFLANLIFCRRDKNSTSLEKCQAAAQICSRVFVDENRAKKRGNRSIVKIKCFLTMLGFTRHVTNFRLIQFRYLRVHKCEVGKTCEHTVGNFNFVSLKIVILLKVTPCDKTIRNSTSKLNFHFENRNFVQIPPRETKHEQKRSYRDSIFVFGNIHFRRDPPTLPPQRCTTTSPAKKVHPILERFSKFPSRRMVFK